MQFNNQILKVQQSKIRQFNDFATSVNVEYKATLGEPDFYTPNSISNKAIEAILDHQTKYSLTKGRLDLRKKICEFEKKANNVDYLPDEVIVTHGSTEGLTAAFFTILNEGDEVVIPNPSYPMYRQIIEYCKAKVVNIDTTKSNFQITKEQLEAVVTEKTKCIVLTSPNNPTGVILNDDSLENVYQIVKDKDIFVICDDVYNQIVYGRKKVGFVKYQDLKDKIIVCQSFSKSYAMPGWRCGYLLGGEEFITHATKIHQYMIVCLNTFIQPAMIEALDYDNKAMVESYKKRRDYVYNRLVKMGLDVIKPNGAFYIFPSIKKFNMSSLDFCKKLAVEQKVALIPGDCFEADDYIRISYCIDKKDLKIILNRLESFINSL